MFELVPSLSRRGAVEVKWFQAYPLRQGVGSRAMQQLQKLAREDGISLTLFPWDKGQVSQSKLTKFYRGQGFAPAQKGSKAMQWTPEIAEDKIKLSTDPNWYGAEVGDYKASGPVVNIPSNQLVGFEPDDKMNQTASKANVEKIIAGLKQGAKLPPLLVRKYKNGYQVLDGHHRFWAYKLLGVKTIPAQIVPAEDVEEIGKQGVAESLQVDVPNEEWLQDKIDYAKSKGRNSFGVPYLGATTAYVRPNVRVPVSVLQKLPGMRDEQKNVRRHDLVAIMKIMKDTNKLPLDRGEEYAPFVNVAWNGEAWVNEGNHRIMAAAALGWRDLPVQISYFDGGERVKSGPMYPGKIGL
jgi:hypothetical protein